jgi:hypothetical protein
MTVGGLKQELQLASTLTLQSKSGLVLSFFVELDFIFFSSVALVRCGIPMLV